MPLFTRVPRAAIAIISLSALAACGGKSSPAPPTTPPGDGVVQVTGTEKIGWDQSAASPSDLQSFSYVVFVDGAQRSLGGASCDLSAGASGFPCTAPLPTLTNGQHTLQLATVRTADGVAMQSDPSATLTVLKVSSLNAVSARGAEPLNVPGASAADRGAPGGHDRPETDRVAVIADQLHEPTAIAATADRRIFIAERERILLVENGALRPEPSLVLTVAGVDGEGGFPDLTLDPEFDANHLVWSSQIVEERARRVVRIVRYTEAGGNLGASAVIAELPVGVTAGRTRIRVAPDGKLNVSIAALSPSGSRDSIYEGSIVRLERDGTTPRDNPAPGLVLSGGRGNLRAIAFASDSSEMWDVVAENGTSSIEALSLSAQLLQAGRVTVSAPRRFSFSAAADLTGFSFVPGAEPLTAVATSPDTQSLYRLVWRGGTLMPPLPIVSARFGPLREVAVAPDGSIYATTAHRSDSDRGRGDLLIRVVPR